MRASNYRAVAIAAMAPTAWGSTYLVTTELLPPGRPFLAAVRRAMPAGLLLLALTRKLPQGRWWAKAAVLGVLNIGGFFALPSNERARGAIPARPPWRTRRRAVPATR